MEHIYNKIMNTHLGEAQKTLLNTRTVLTERERERERERDRDRDRDRDRQRDRETDRETETERAIPPNDVIVHGARRQCSMIKIARKKRDSHQKENGGA